MLPRKRPRALTCPLPAQSRRSWNPFKQIVQQTFHQTQSALFTQLPSEIRLQIWSEVLGGHLLHVVRAPKTLLAIPCGEDFGPGLATRKHRCWESDIISIEPTPGFYHGPRNPDIAKPGNLLPLLRTCRKVYMEAISVLYNGNIFDINHVDTPMYLQRLVLPRRLNQIHIVNFAWEFKYHTGLAQAPYDLATWREACDVLASLAGLQELTMHLTGYDLTPGANTKCYWGPLLETLARIKPAKKFHVFLPWSDGQCSEAKNEEGYSFMLIPMVEP